MRGNIPVLNASKALLHEKPKAVDSTI